MISSKLFIKIAVIAGLGYFALRLLPNAFMESAITGVFWAFGFLFATYIFHKLGVFR